MAAYSDCFMRLLNTLSHSLTFIQNGSIKLLDKHKQKHKNRIPRLTVLQHKSITQIRQTYCILSYLTIYMIDLELVLTHSGIVNRNQWMFARFNKKSEIWHQRNIILTVKMDLSQTTQNSITVCLKKAHFIFAYSLAKIKEFWYILA